MRGPGNFCSVVGLKQTFGRVSQRGLMVTSYNGDHIGPMTRSVRDSALVLQVIEIPGVVHRAVVQIVGG